MNIPKPEGVTSEQYQMYNRRYSNSTYRAAIEAALDFGIDQATFGNLLIDASFEALGVQMYKGSYEALMDMANEAAVDPDDNHRLKQAIVSHLSQFDAEQVQGVNHITGEIADRLRIANERISQGPSTLKEIEAVQRLVDQARLLAACLSGDGRSNLVGRTTGLIDAVQHKVYQLNRRRLGAERSKLSKIIAQLDEIAEAAPSLKTDLLLAAKQLLELADGELPPKNKREFAEALQSVINDCVSILIH